MTAKDEKLVRKKKALRHNEYYNMQSIFDNLYALSKNGCNHYNLMDIILSDNNILLAYRNIKRNKGSNTRGTNNSTIKDIANMDEATFIEMVKNRLNNFHPHPVRRVEIPKPGGNGTRPLGIPTIEDRIIQSCIKQVLEPILEAKFYKHSYGFRPNRSTHHAIARFNYLAFRGYHYVVDIDVAGFFDNVNHGKLLKQLWTLGIRDKKLIKIISLMLKAEIEGIGIPNKGTPQGGILSPLLSNVVLNELDHWIASQWDRFPSKHSYTRKADRNTALRKTKLKDIEIIRYADDFKIMCKDYKTAQKIFLATRMWLKERLFLDISKEKSKITNLRKNYSEFLGFKLKVKKGKGVIYTNRSHITEKAKTKVIVKIKNKMRVLQKSPTVENVNKYNATILGLQNYYRIATMVSCDFPEIAYSLNKSLKCRTKKIRSDKGADSKAYNKFYGNYNYKKIYIAGSVLFPIDAVKFSIPLNFSQNITPYTPEGRAEIHTNLRFDTTIMTYLMSNPIPNRSTEYNDNRISLYAGQVGKCFVSGEPLQIGCMEVHHVIPTEFGGGDNYDNLIYVTEPVHMLVHATKPETIEYYKSILKLNKASLKKLNKLRSKVGNDVIVNTDIDGTPCDCKQSRTVLGKGKAGNSQDTEGLPIATG